MKRGDGGQTRVAFLLLGLFVFIFALLYIRPWGDHGALVISDLSYVLCAGIATVFGIVATRTYGTHSPLGKALLFLTITTGLDTLAGIIWATYEIALGVLNPFPSVADATWMLFYVTAIVGLSIALKTVLRQIPRNTKIIALVLWTLTIISVYSFAIGPQLADTNTTMLEKLAGIQYPVGDLIILLLCGLLFTTLRRGVFGTAWLSVFIGLIIYSIADLIYSYMIWIGTYHSGSMLDVLWPAGQLLWAYGFYKHLQFAKV